MLSSIKNATRSLGHLVRGKDDFGSGTRSATKARDYAVLGGTVGAVAGATIGTIKGFQSQANNSVTETLVEKPINHPELRGYNHSTITDRDTYCVERKDGHCVDYDSKVRGWTHTYSPDIRNKVVGTYSEPQFGNSKFLQPLSGALIGGVAGGLVGVAAGLGLAALTKSMGSDDVSLATQGALKLSDESKMALANQEGSSMEGDEAQSDALDTRLGAYAIAGTAVGAGVGVYLGVQAGAAEVAANQANTRTWSVPTFRNETIGHIPGRYYEPKGFLQFSPESGRGRPEYVPVNGKVPVYNSDGTVKMAQTEKTFHSQRYGKVAGGIAGGFIGAGVGLAAGVSVGLADKLISQGLDK